MAKKNIVQESEIGSEIEPEHTPMELEQAASDVAKFVLDHLGDIEKLYTLLRQGRMSREDATQAIRQMMIAASDAQMEIELGRNS